MVTNIKPKPSRSCVVCRTTCEKQALVRFVRTDEGILLDESARRNGRGAYVCRQASCLNEAIKKQSLQRVLKSQMAEGTLQQINELAKQIGGVGNGE